MSSRHRFLEKSIDHVSFHNRLTEEDSMWRRRDQERNRLHERDRSRSAHQHHRLSTNDRDQRKSHHSTKATTSQAVENEFGPPLPSNLGINADRWDHAFFLQRYPEVCDKEKKTLHRTRSSSNEQRETKQTKKKHHRQDKVDEVSKKKSQRRHRSRS
jgi:hypothetical protein